MNKPIILPAGRKLTDWIRSGGKPERASSFILWMYRWRALWLERSYQALLNSGPAMEPFPYFEGQGLVFIQGFWRSGTTLLHELLAEIPGCAAPRTWQCMDPSAVLTPLARPRTNQSVQRPMDQVIVSPFSPQEDEFALLVMGCPSIYQGFLDPRRLPELARLSDATYWATETQWLKTLEAFLAWCAKPGQNRMIIKSPNHVFRTEALAERFPKAQFVWIFRDPAAVWQSNLKMWRVMTERYSLWAAPPGVLEGFLGSAFAAYANLLEDMYGRGCFHEQPACAYEDLTSRASVLLPVLIDRLGLGPWSEFSAALQAGQLAKPQPAVECADIPPDAPVSLLSRLHEIQQAILND